jgi:uncharacterized protein
MATYHQRRPEKAITIRTEMLDIIDGQAIMTLAMCKENEPYLVTVDYAFDPSCDCFYFHCGRAGKKMDYLRVNPVVWGQVIEDIGYVDGECDHAFRSVHFRGRVTFLDSAGDKRKAVYLMIDHLESDPDTVKARFAKPDALDDVVIAQVHVEEMTAKEGPAPGKPGARRS